MDNSELTRSKLSVSFRTAVLWLWSMVIITLISSVANWSHSRTVISVIAATAMAVAAMYGAVMIDMEIDRTRVQVAIQIAISVIATFIIAAYLVLFGEITLILMPGAIALTIATMFITAFVIYVGSSAFLCAAMCMADRH